MCNNLPWFAQQSTKTTLGLKYEPRGHHHTMLLLVLLSATSFPYKSNWENNIYSHEYHKGRLQLACRTGRFLIQSLVATALFLAYCTQIWENQTVSWPKCSQWDLKRVRSISEYNRRDYIQALHAVSIQYVLRFSLILPKTEPLKVWAAQKGKDFTVSHISI